MKNSNSKFAALVMALVLFGTLVLPIAVAADTTPYYNKSVTTTNTATYKRTYLPSEVPQGAVRIHKDIRLSDALGPLSVVPGSAGAISYIVDITSKQLKGVESKDIYISQYLMPPVTSVFPLTNTYVPKNKNVIGIGVFGSYYEVTYYDRWN